MFKPMPLTILIAISTSLFMDIAFYVAFKPPVIATVDVMSVTSQFIKSEAHKNRSNHEKMAAIRAFSHELESALNELSKSKSLILMPREAVIQGGHDYTETLIHMMEESKS